MCIKLYEGIQYELIDRWQSTGHVSAVNDMQVALLRKKEQSNTTAVVWYIFSRTIRYWDKNTKLNLNLTNTTILVCFYH